jgi:hypothetical protein
VSIDVGSSFIFTSLKKELSGSISSFSPEEQKLVTNILYDYSRMSIMALSQGNPKVEKAHLEAQMANIKGRAADETKRIIMKVTGEILSTIVMKGLPIVLAAI